MSGMVTEKLYVQETLPVLTDDDIEMLPFAAQFERADTGDLQTLAIDLDSELCAEFNSEKYEQLTLIEIELATRNQT